MKPSEDGIDKGIVARFWNFKNQSQQLNASFNSGKITGAQLVTSIETPITEAGYSGDILSDSFNPNQIKSYSINYILDLLPVQLSNFSAKIINKDVLLSWETFSEINNYGFEIERTEDNDIKAWGKIGFVVGHGNSNSYHKYEFKDKTSKKSSKYIYRLKQIDANGEFTYSNEININLNPTEYELFQNYPNPFNPSTKIGFSIPKDGVVKLSLFNVLGEKLSQILSKHFLAGYHEVELDLSSLSSGIYFYRLDVNNFSQTKKMVIIR